MSYTIKQKIFTSTNLPILNDNVFLNGESIIQLGIQAPPKTRFYLNLDNQSYSEDIEIGKTGIFEIDLKDTDTVITWLSFSNIIKDKEIIIDYLCYG